MDRTRGLWRKPLLRIAVLVPLMAMLLSVGVFAVGRSSSVDAAPAKGADSPKFKHIFIIMMENTGIEALLGNPNAPWINQEIQTAGVAGNYYGVTHPSQPNYIAATSGALNGVLDDNDITINVPNVVDQLESHGKSWTAYMQSLSLCTTKLDHACGNQLYERKHNPFVSYQDVQSSPTRMANIVDLSQLSADLASNHVANYVWISPDQCNDMHGRAATPSDPCDFSQAPSLIAAGDTFLHNTVSQIIASRVWKDDSVIYITWDESDFTGAGFQGFGDDRGCCDSPVGQGGGHVLTLVISRDDDARSTFTPYNHYSLLATVEQNWRLGCLGNTCDTANVGPIKGFAG